MMTQGVPLHDGEAPLLHRWYAPSLLGWMLALSSVAGNGLLVCTAQILTPGGRWTAWGVTAVALAVSAWGGSQLVVGVRTHPELIGLLTLGGWRMVPTRRIRKAVPAGSPEAGTTLVAAVMTRQSWPNPYGDAVLVSGNSSGPRVRPFLVCPWLLQGGVEAVHHICSMGGIPPPAMVEHPTTPTGPQLAVVRAVQLAGGLLCAPALAACGLLVLTRAALRIGIPQGTYWGVAALLTAVLVWSHVAGLSLALRRAAHGGANEPTTEGSAGSR